jgi:hypothetical protein
MAARRHVGEEAFEIACDAFSRKARVLRVPRAARAATAARAPPLLAGWRIFVRPPLQRMTPQEMESCLLCAGATCVLEDPTLTAGGGGSGSGGGGGGRRPSDVVVVTSLDPEMSSRAVLQDLRDAATAAGVTVVDQMWFLESVSQWRTVDVARWSWDGGGTRRLERKRAGEGQQQQ